MGLLTRSAPAPVTAEQVHQARQRHYEEEQAEQRERQAAQRKAEWDARQAKEVEQRRRQQERQETFAAERDRLQAELQNAEAARAKLAVAVDLSSPESAFDAIGALSLRSAADELVERARRTLDAHKPRP